LAKPIPTKDRSKCGIPQRTIADKTTNSKGVKLSWKSERVVYDDDGNILGVETFWQ
jgi:hypothetical protein